jgi:predicted hydrocarbon binding protein
VAIDGQKIIHAVMEGSRYRDAKGIIPLFGVYLSLFSVRYYNKLSFEFETTIKDTNPYNAETLLTDAAQECGYATFHGIRNSREWEEIVLPMIEKPEDQLEGFVAVAVAFGWGDLQIVELVPNERLVVRANESYEATGYLESYGFSNSSKCYMLRGVCGAFMDLIYGEAYPEGCFTFSAIEEKCRAKGDKFCEFVVKKSFKKKSFF